MKALTIFLCRILELGSLAVGQTQPAAPTNSSSSEEPFVIQQHSVRMVVQKDGTSVTEEHLRVRIQSEAGLQRYGILVVPFASANTMIEQLALEVVKADGTVVSTPASSIQDFPSDITRAAPFYSDLREKHVPVKGLGIGDTIKFDVRQQTHSPIPGQFWYVYNFPKTDVVLDGRLELSVPSDTFLNVKSPDVTPLISNVGNRREYVWRFANLKRQPTPKCVQHNHPSVQLTTFRDWSEVGQWYHGLAEKQAAPSPEIRSKTAAITRGAKTDEEKLQAIYGFVATNIRYIGVAFGIGRYQPHTAAEVLANAYGDCKDKHTLLEAMLSAADIKAYPALIGFGMELDADVPYPGQFNHVITTVPLNTRTIWLDSTTEVAPFGMLVAPLRDKQALVITSSDPTLTRTPEQPPFKDYQIIHVDAKLNDSGILNAKVDMQARGDTELLLRLGFRQVGHSQWQELAQRISQAMGFGGKVSDVSISTPEDTSQPFHLQYTYTRENYSDWKNHQITAPLPPMEFPHFTDEQRDCPSLPFSDSLNVSMVATIEVPAGYIVEVPEPVNIQQSFAHYDANYSFVKGVLQVERHLTTSAKELSSADLKHYKDFESDLNDDEYRYIPLTKAVASNTASTDEAVKLYQEGSMYLQKRDFHQALDEFNHVLKLQPGYPGAWAGVGLAHAALAEMDEAIEAFRKEIELHPTTEGNYKALGKLLMYLHRPDEAVEVWKQLIVAKPKDRDAAQELGEILLSQKRYGEAASSLQSALKVNPDDAGLHAQLGDAYLQLSKLDEGAAELVKAVALRPQISNNAAYMLAENNTHLNDALQMAQTAVHEVEKRSCETDLTQAKATDFEFPPTLSAYWDTLGWVYFRLGQSEKARQYLYAAWVLSQDASVGDHLAQVYEKLGKRDLAIHTYALSTAANQGDTEAHKHLLQLVHRESAVEDMVRKSRDELSRLRTIRLANVPERGSAEFLILFASGQRPTLKFISGDEKVKAVQSRLETAHYELLFPDDNPTKLLRRGVLACPKTGLQCDFALVPITSVHSAN